MRNQLLRDADWAAMAHSLEIRTPLVDSHLLDALAPIVPMLTPGLGKEALGQAPSRPLGDHIAKRPKTGFAVPTGRWLEEAMAEGSPGSVPALRAHKGMASRAWARRIYDKPAALSSAA
jgi:asparagine synthase (glutamine-hydrolysing)